MPSRRAALGTGGALLLGAISGCSGRRFEADATPRGEWRAARHGARNTGHAPDATPPGAAPTTAWRRSFPAGDDPVGLLVAHGHLYVVRPTGVSALAAATGELRWETDGRGQAPADGVPRTAGAAADALYTADGTGVRAFDADGALRWTATTSRIDRGHDVRAYGLLPSRDGLLWATHGRLSAFGRDGGHRWTFDAAGADALYPAVADGRLYVAAPGPLLAATRSGALDALLDGGPAVEWRADAPGRPTWPVVTDERVLVGDRDFVGSGHHVRAFRTDGTEAWDVPVRGRTSHLAVSPEDGLAVFVAGGEDGSDGVVSAVEVASGDRAWTRDDLGVTDALGSIGIAGDTCLVGGFSARSRAPVRALDAATGETVWTATVTGGVTALAAVEDRIYVGTGLGDVVALA